jgi:hypothetical protein
LSRPAFFVCSRPRPKPTASGSTLEPRQWYWNAATTKNAAELIPFASFDVSPAGVFGAFSGSLLQSAALSQWAGKAIDERDATCTGVTDCFTEDPMRAVSG